MIDSGNSEITGYRDLANVLRGNIEAGKLPAGSPVPSERDLMQTYGLGRQTVRRAIGLLRNEGRIVVVHGRGSIVQPAINKQTVRIRRHSHGEWRMPTPEERRQLGVSDGIPVLVVTFAGESTVYPGDRWEFTTA